MGLGLNFIGDQPENDAQRVWGENFGTLTVMESCWDVVEWKKAISFIEMDCKHRTEASTFSESLNYSNVKGFVT